MSKLARLMLCSVLVGCGGGGGDDGGGDDGGGGGGDDDGGGTGTGKLAMTGHMAGAARHLRGADARIVSHVMAVNPESASPQRTLAQVQADGSFALNLDTGVPYVLVFLDSTAVGADMVVGIARAQTLDTLAPQKAGALDLGAVTTDPATQSAALGISYDALLAGLGLSASGAAYLGAVDDLSLRYANPDIDGDGVIDLVQDHRYALDFHVRSTMKLGSATGPSVTVDDLTDQFLAASGATVATPVFNLTSAYVEYPASVDATTYVSISGVPGNSLSHGAAFSATEAGVDAPFAPTSFSGLSFGTTAGWGADYDYTASADLELPGSGGTPATLQYTLGASSTTLTFSNVVTRSRAALTDTGTLAIFLRLNAAGGQYTSIDYQWMKRDSATTWIPATADEIALTISGDGGYVSFHRAPAWSNEFGVAIPAQPTGSLAWTFPASGPDDLCAVAVSYDDKLGLRHFIGGADANPGVTCTF